MFDISKAKLQPQGKWDSEAQMPRDMSYKSTAKAVLNRHRNTRLAIWTFIATLAFAFGWTSTLVLSMTLTVAVSVGLALLTVYRVVNMIYWTRAGKAALASADAHIKDVDPAIWNQPMVAKQKNGATVAETPPAQPTASA